MQRRQLTEQGQIQRRRARLRPQQPTPRPLYEHVIHHFSGGPLHLQMREATRADDTLDFACQCEPAVLGVTRYNRTAIWSTAEAPRTLHAMYRHDPNGGACDCV